jgi:hypothetical protein
MIFDVKHFEEQVVKRGLRMLHQPREAIIDALRRGCVKIDQDYDFEIGDYMIISDSVGVKIPITVKKDRYVDRVIGLVPTLLLKNSKYDIQRDYYKNVLIESRGKVIAIPLVDEFIDFFENGEFVPSYETINV